MANYVEAETLYRRTKRVYKAAQKIVKLTYCKQPNTVGENCIDRGNYRRKNSGPFEDVYIREKPYQGWCADCKNRDALDDLKGARKRKTLLEQVKDTSGARPRSLARLEKMLQRRI